MRGTADWMVVFGCGLVVGWLAHGIWKRITSSGSGAEATS